MIRPALTALALLVPGTALAEVPAVIVDTAPVHSLVAIVMGDLGTPDLLLPPGMSPHDAALRPSDAARLTTAGLIVWTGPGFVPWLEEPIAQLAPGAVQLPLLAQDGWTRLPLRDDPAFEADEDDHDHEHESESADGPDPHAWLDPAVAGAWMTAVAEALAGLDPENATVYAANVLAGQAALTDLTDAIDRTLAPVRGRQYLVSHDALQYFETRFDIPAAGAIALSDAAAPGPAHMADLRARVTGGDIVCVLTDPETSPDRARLLTEGTDVATAAIDPDGIGLTPGPDLYGALMSGIAAAMADCMSGT